MFEKSMNNKAQTLLGLSGVSNMRRCLIQIRHSYIRLHWIICFFQIISGVGMIVSMSYPLSVFASVLSYIRTEFRPTPSIQTQLLKLCSKLIPKWRKKIWYANQRSELCYTFLVSTSFISYFTAILLFA